MVSTLEAARDANVVVVVNPNNPDGRIVPRADLLELARDLGRRRGLLVVDEAFADTHPDVCVARTAGRGGLLVLRSFGKFYGLAGVRLGFAIGAAADVRRLAAWLGPWAVNGPALAIGQEALRDLGWAGAMRTEIRRRAGDVVRLLACHGFRVVGDAGLFVLAAHPQATLLHGHLARQGVWTRRFDAESSWLRIGLPPGKEIGRLDQALDRAMRALGGGTS
jgi:cobalamin biosynthetic protein CobC